MIKEGAASIVLDSCYGGAIFENKEIAEAVSDNNTLITALGSRKHDVTIAENDSRVSKYIEGISLKKPIGCMRMEDAISTEETIYCGPGNKIPGLKDPKSIADDNLDIVS